MPGYYTCPHCGHKWQRRSNIIRRRCSRCGKTSTQSVEAKQPR